MSDDCSEALSENQSDETAPNFKLTRASITSLNVYEVSEYELVQFEQGGNSSTAFGFATFLLSGSISFLIVILTVDLSKNDRAYFSFFILTVTGAVLGVYMLSNWWRGHKSLRDLGRTVRARLPKP